VACVSVTGGTLLQFLSVASARMAESIFSAGDCDDFGR
jgi:hypothetical protein